MENNSGNGFEKSCGECAVSSLMWWTTLAVAVVAVPSFAVAISYLSPFRGLGADLVFILACWLSTYLGMRLMTNPVMDKKIGGDKNDA